MSAARSHSPEDTSRPQHEAPPDRSGHRFRTVLLLSLLIAALILWQLTPIIHGLQTAAAELRRAQTVRRALIGVAARGYRTLDAKVGPLIHRWHP